MSQGAKASSAAHCIITIPCLVACVILAAVSGGITDDATWLNQLYTQTGGNTTWSTTCRSGWNLIDASTATSANATVCNGALYGVTCTTASATAVVTSVSLSGCDLSGPLPTLSTTQMGSLRSLFLNNNALTGSLPDFPTSPSSIQTVMLNSNSFTGSIPSSWSSLASLTNLSMSRNMLSGLLPVWSMNVPSLSALDFSYNSLSATLPMAWSTKITSLQSLKLQYNSLNGTLPSEWSSLSSLTSLSISYNLITGSLPPNWSALTSLQSLSLSSNSFTSSLPGNWSNMSSLRSLLLDGNSLNGSLPTNWSRLTQLSTLSLGNNMLSGSAPFSWSSLSSLQSLTLQNNSLSGSLPSQWSSLTALTSLSMSNNTITGSLPSNWSALTRVQSLSLSSNSLSSSLPGSWSTMTSLQSLFLDSNSLNESLPTNWSHLTQLSTLSLSSNMLSGSLPSSWSSLLSLQSLSLQYNSLNGSLPSTWSSIASLTSLYLSSNALNGSLPSSWSNLTSLRSLLLDSNSLSGSLPRWSSIAQLNAVSISNNALSGTLPSSWSSLSSLQSVSLQNNSLSGSIPQSWSSLSSLQSIALADNFLHGVVPQAISNITLSDCSLDKNCFLTDKVNISLRNTRFASCTISSQRDVLYCQQNWISQTETKTPSLSSAKHSRTSNGSVSVATLSKPSNTISITTVVSTSRTRTTSYATRWNSSPKSSSVSLTHTFSVSRSLAKTSSSKSLSHSCSRSRTNKKTHHSASLSNTSYSSPSLAVASVTVLVPLPPTNAPPSSSAASTAAAIAESVSQGVGVGSLAVGASFAPVSTAAVTSLMMLQTSMGALAASKRCQVGYIRSATKSTTANAPPPVGSTLVSNPIQLAVRSDAIDSDLQYAAGSIIGNIVVVACAAVLIEGGMMLWTNRQRIGDKQVLLEGVSGVWGALPGRGTAVFSSLLLPSVSSCTAVFHHASAMPISFGVVGLLVYVVSPLALMLLTLRHTYSIETTDGDATAKPDGNGVGAQHWSLQRFRSFLDGFSLQYRWYCVVDFATAVLCGILAALPEDSSSPACKWAIWATLGVMATATLSAAVLRPREEVTDNIFSILNRSLSTAIVALSAAGELDAAAVASSALSCLCLVPPVLAVMKNFPLDRLRRRGGAASTHAPPASSLDDAMLLRGDTELHNISDAASPQNVNIRKEEQLLEEHHQRSATLIVDKPCGDLYSLVVADTDVDVVDVAAAAASIVPLLLCEDDADREHREKLNKMPHSFFGMENYFIESERCHDGVADAEVVDQEQQHGVLDTVESSHGHNNYVSK